MPDTNSIRCGVAGWSYPHWDRIVYPHPRPKGFHPLEYLSRFFDVLEINTSFYGPVRPEVSRAWLRKVSGNPRLQFTAKLGRLFTHERRLEPRQVTAFIEGLRPLREAGRLGCVLMQFPWSFRFTEENREFLIRLRRTFHYFPLAAEFRHSSWLQEEALGLLIDYHIGFCNIDQPQRQSCMPPAASLTTSLGYVRLHGRGYGGWFQEFEPRPEESHRDYLYRAEELQEWAGRIARLRRFAEAVYVVFTNDAAGRSVVNALQMRSLLGLPAKAAPASLASLWRRQLADFEPDGPRQEPLFIETAAVA